MKTCRFAALVVVGIAGCLWATAFLAEFVPAALTTIPGQQGHLLRDYSRSGLIFSTGLLFFALLGAALSLAADAGAAFASQRWISGASAAELIPSFVLAIACIAITARDPQIPRMIADAYSKNVHSAPMSSMGPVLPEDIRLARAVTATVRGTEKILLPGVVAQMSEWELWYFTVGGSRSIPLYTDVPFAFFHGTGTTATEYRDRVCDRLDLPWLASHGIVWLYESQSVAGWACVHAWDKARDRYFELKLRDGSASLWRLRTDLLPQVTRDLLPAR